MIKLRQIEFFRAVMLHGSINRASHYLCVSQPVVSRVISKLENDIGLTLFERKASHLVPTKNAYVLNRYCDDIFETTNRLGSVIKSLQGEQVEHLKFCASPALCSSFMPKLIAKFDKNIRIHFESSMIRDMPSNIESGFYEFGLTIWPIPSEKVDCIPVADSGFIFLCHNSNPLRQLPRIRFEHLVDQEFIFTNRSMPVGEYIERRFNEIGVSCEKYLEVDRAEIVCSLINSGRGVSIINRHGFDQEQWKNITAIELEKPIHANVYLIVPKLRDLSSAAAAFIDFLKAECATEKQGTTDPHS